MEILNSCHRSTRDCNFAFYCQHYLSDSNQVIFLRAHGHRWAVLLQGAD